MGKLIHFGSPAEDVTKPQATELGVSDVEAALDPEKYKHPSGIEPLNIIAYESYFRGEVIKLVMSAPYNKEVPEILSLLKAVTYLSWEIERVSKGQYKIAITENQDDEDDEED